MIELKVNACVNICVLFSVIVDKCVPRCAILLSVVRSMKQDLDVWWNNESLTWNGMKPNVAANSPLFPNDSEYVSLFNKLWASNAVMHFVSVDVVSIVFKWCDNLRILSTVDVSVLDSYENKEYFDKMRYKYSRNSQYIDLMISSGT